MKALAFLEHISATEGISHYPTQNIAVPRKILKAVIILEFKPISFYERDTWKRQGVTEDPELFIETPSARLVLQVNRNCATAGVRIAFL